jgi:hypothetical protein
LDCLDVIGQYRRAVFPMSASSLTNGRVSTSAILEHAVGLMFERWWIAASNDKGHGVS